MKNKKKREKHREDRTFGKKTWGEGREEGKLMGLIIYKRGTLLSPEALVNSKE